MAKTTKKQAPKKTRTKSKIEVDKQHVWTKEQNDKLEKYVKETQEREKERKRKELTEKIVLAMLSNPKLYFRFQFTFWKKVRNFFGLNASLEISPPLKDWVVRTAREYADEILK